MNLSILSRIRQGGAALIFCLLFFLALLAMPGEAAYAIEEENTLQLDQTVFLPDALIELRYYKGTKNAVLELRDGAGELLQTAPLPSGKNDYALDLADIQPGPGSYTLTYRANPQAAGVSREIRITEQPFYLDHWVFEKGTDGVFSFSEGREGAWIGIYPLAGGEPASPGEVWGYLPKGSGKIFSYTLDNGKKSFRELEPGEYAAYYFPEDSYGYTQAFPFRILDTGAMAANYQPAQAGQLTAEGRITISSGQAKGERYYWLYWGNSSGPLAGYSALGSTAVPEKGTASLNIPAGVEAPAGADRLYLYPGTAQEKSRIALPYVLLMPERMRAEKGPALFSFGIVTDSHVTQTPSHSYNRQYKKVLDDVSDHFQGIRAFLNLGDLVNNGKESEYRVFAKMTEAYCRRLPKQYFLMGNHDMALNRKESEEQKALFTQYTGMPGVFYSFTIGDYAFICLGSEGPGEGIAANTETAYLSQDQLLWLEGELAAAQEAAGPEHPIFVFLHQPLMATVAATEYAAINEDARLREILSDYPQAILFSGHTHAPLNGRNALWQGDFRAVHGGCVSRFWSEERQRYLRGSQSGSQGCLVEVYENGVQVKGRDFRAGEWLPSAWFWLPNWEQPESALPEEPASEETIPIETPTQESSLPEEKPPANEEGEESGAAENSV